MIADLLTALGDDYREADGAGVGRFSAIYVMQSPAGYRFAHVLAEDVLQEKAAIDIFARALTDRSLEDETTPEMIGQLPKGVYWISRAIPDHPKSLQHHLKTTGVFATSEVVRIGARICDALSETHGRDQLHGGLTPGNIFIADDHIWLPEAGVHRALEAIGADTSQPSTALQSSYVSPEESTAQIASPHSEIFSLGVVLYELLTGKRPFGGRTTTMVMATILTDDTTLSGELGAAGSEEADRVVAAILRALEKDPADRWSSAAQFAAALRGEIHTTQLTGPAPREGCMPHVLLIAGSAGLLHHLLS